MTTYFTAPDGHGEPTLWAQTDDPQCPLPILSRKDLWRGKRSSHHWDELVARVIAGNLSATEQWALDQAASRWTLQQILDNQDDIADHFERGHKWTIVLGDPTAHCKCGATMNVPVVRT